jgi:TPR repeat protein
LSSIFEPFRRRKLQRVAQALETAFEGNAAGFDLLDTSREYTRGIARMYLDALCAVSASRLSRHQMKSLASRFELSHPLSTAASTETLPIPPYGNVIVISEMSSSLADEIALTFPSFPVTGWRGTAPVGVHIRETASRLAAQLQAMRSSDAATHPLTTGLFLSSEAGADKAHAFLRLRHATLGAQVSHEYCHGLVNLGLGGRDPQFKLARARRVREALREIQCDYAGFSLHMRAEDFISEVVKQEKCTYFITDNCTKPKCTCRTRGRHYYTEFLDNMCAAQLATNDAARLLRTTSEESLPRFVRWTFLARRLAVLDHVTLLLAKAPQRRASLVRCLLLAVNLQWRSEALSWATRLFHHAKHTQGEEHARLIEAMLSSWARPPLLLRIVAVTSRFVGLAMLVEWNRFRLDRIESASRRAENAASGARVSSPEIADAEILLGMGYDSEDESDLDSATAYLTSAVAMGSPEASHRLGVLAYQAGDLSSARLWWTRLSDEEAIPETMLGLIQLEIDDGDLDAAMRRTERAADHGEPRGFSLLGQHYHQARDAQAAARCWRRGADMGDSGSAYFLGVLHALNDEWSEATELWRLAAVGGHEEALLALADVLAAQGDLTGAESLWQTAEAGGSARARLTRRLYIDGDPSVAQELASLIPGVSVAATLDAAAAALYQAGLVDQAERYWRMSGRTGSPNAALALASLALARDDVSEAEGWLEVSAAAGEPSSLFNLAVIADQGDDSARASTLFRQAAEAGHAGAMHVVFQLLSEVGNEDEALKMLRASAELGYAPALNDLGAYLARAGEYDDAREMFLHAQGLGEVEATANLGLLEMNLGNVTEARRWWLEAASAGFEPANTALADLGDI